MLKILRINAFRQRSVVFDHEANANLTIGKVEAPHNNSYGVKAYQLGVGTYEVILDLQGAHAGIKKVFPENGILFHMENCYWVEKQIVALMTVTNGFVNIPEGAVITEPFQEVETKIVITNELIPDAVVTSEPIVGITLTNEPQELLLENEVVEEKLTKKWWTDGENSVKAFECPGEGWRRGRAGNPFQKKEVNND